MLSNKMYHRMKKMSILKSRFLMAEEGRKMFSEEDGHRRTGYDDRGERWDGTLHTLGSNHAAAVTVEPAEVAIHDLNLSRNS